ncbi:helix-turn-helix domain-containing protein [Thalassovita sp.]|uniref:helix-turn-helix domain-containing protein n=1 Tax=Thalassovita sp. TaxID=1979401 RepID=UPI0029DE5767|nr:RodZ domain-containing protein [Thalassovita sp.]
MIRRKTRRIEEDQQNEPKGFDAFEMRLGDLMRGERATMGKSLLDVQRELRIRASYIAAIENADPSAFDTPGFIAGYVRSYARYLGMDPDQAFVDFCRESGFATAHGMSAEASSIRKKAPAAPVKPERDAFLSSGTPFAPAKEAFLSRIEPGAIGSALVLLLLIGSIGFGGYTVLNEVQRVQMAPVENTPDVLADLDPLGSRPLTASQNAEAVAGLYAPQAEAPGRLYRPQALDVPVMVARDAPISTLDPDSVGSFQSEVPASTVLASASDTPRAPQSVPQVVETAAPGVEMVAVRPAWVRVRAADGSVIFEGIMEAGDRWPVPQTEDAPTLRVGESGAIYFAMNGQHYGPAGQRGTVTSNLALSVENLSATYAVADLTQHTELARTVAEAN